MFTCLNLENTPTFLHSGYLPCPSQSSGFNHFDYIRWTVQTMKFLIVEPSLLPILITVGPKYSPQDPVSNYGLLQLHYKMWLSPIITDSFFLNLIIIYKLHDDQIIHSILHHRCFEKWYLKTYIVYVSIGNREGNFVCSVGGEVSERIEMGYNCLESHNSCLVSVQIMRMDWIRTRDAEFN